MGKGFIYFFLCLLDGFFSFTSSFPLFCGARGKKTYYLVTVFFLIRVLFSRHGVRGGSFFSFPFFSFSPGIRTGGEEDPECYAVTPLAGMSLRVEVLLPQIWLMEFETMDS